MLTHYNVKETALTFTSLEPDMKQSRGFQANGASDVISRAFGKTNQAPTQRFNVSCVVFFIQVSKLRCRTTHH